MSGHADTIRRIRNQLPADVARDFDALLAENQHSVEDVAAISAQCVKYAAENQRLREALERISSISDFPTVASEIAREELRSEQ